MVLWFYVGTKWGFYLDDEEESFSSHKVLIRVPKGYDEVLM